MEIKRLILKFLVNFNRNQVYDTRFTTVNSSETRDVSLLNSLKMMLLSLILIVPPCQFIHNQTKDDQ